MSEIDTVIASHCPDGVEFVEIGKVVQRAPNIKWDERAEEKFQYIDLASVDRLTNRIVETSTIDSKSAPSRAQQEVRAGDVLFGTTRPTLQRYCLVGESHDGQVASTGFCVLRPTARISSNWLYHLLGTAKFYEYIEANQRGASYPAISDTLVKRFKIPVPPLVVQGRIVKVLDRIENLKSKLEADLRAELEHRFRQYDFYRDQLMAFRQIPGVRWVPIREVARVARGASPRPIQAFLTDSGDGVPWIKIGDVPATGKYITGTAERVTSAGAEKSRRVSPGDFVLSNSMSFGRPYISQIDGCIHDGWLAISEFETSFVPDFLYHLLRSTVVQTEFARRAGAGTVSNLNAEIVRAIVVPVPARDEQQRIVEILDKFEGLVRNLAAELPTEIDARRQQYGYYRDKLLTFEESA